MAVKHGNLPLGQVYKLLISIIGRDAALTIAEEHGIPIFGKDLDRIFEEKDINFTRLRPSEKTGAMELIRNFFKILEKQYGFPENVGLLNITVFFEVYQNALMKLTPYEKQTKEIALYLLRGLGFLLMSKRDSESQDIYTIKKLLNDTYDLLFDKVFENLGMTKTQFYEEVKKFYNRKSLADFEQALKRDITKCCKNNTNEPWVKDWNKFKAILDFLNSKDEKERVHRLIRLYLLKNAEASLKDVCGIEQKDIYSVKQNILKWANKESRPKQPSDEDFEGLDFKEQIGIIQNCHAYLRGKTAIEPDRARQYIEALEKECPQRDKENPECLLSGIFFVSWANARLAVLSCKFDGSEEDKKLKEEALEGYYTAFDKGRNFAGEYLKEFLEESIAATVYFDRKETKDIPDVIDTDKKDTTPITKYAKRYYEYGYTLNLTELESSKTFSLHFNTGEHFWKVFPVFLFTHGESVGQYKFTEDMLKARWWFHFLENVDDQGIVDNSFDSIKHTKELKNKSKDTINNRMDLFPGYDIQYTPLTIALMTRQLDIAESYLERFADSLDDAKINTDGSTALLESILQYKLIRFMDRRDPDALLQAKKFKEIILKLIERSPFDALYSERVTDYISVLEEAINTFDIDIVKAIVEKKGFDIQDLKICVDELSPLYYAIMRYYFLSEANSKEKITIPPNANISWDKANFPGVFTENKMSYYENIRMDPLYKRTEQSSQDSFIGVKSVWEQEFKELKEIVKYLIEKTDEVDKFDKKTQSGIRKTALSLAVESNFDDICRLLINKVEKGANPALIFSNNGMPYDSPFFCAVWFKSWKTLEMLLTDFKEQIQPIMNVRYREDQQTAVHLLFNENSEIKEKFIPLFRNAGADFGIPNISGINVRQILKENNLEHLIKT